MCGQRSEHEKQSSIIAAGWTPSCVLLTRCLHDAHSRALQLLKLCVNTDFIFGSRHQLKETMSRRPSTKIHFLLFPIWNYKRNHENFFLNTFLLNNVISIINKKGTWQHIKGKRLTWVNKLHAALLLEIDLCAEVSNISFFTLSRSWGMCQTSSVKKDWFCPMHWKQ